MGFLQLRADGIDRAHTCAGVYDPRMKLVLGLLIAFGVGAACRYFDIPAPAPSALTGALLVVSMTLGYIAVDRWLKPPPAAVAPHRD
jgi:XapX domain-containing protein